MAETQDNDVALAQAFAEVARVLLKPNEVATTLELICQLAAQTVEA